MSASAQVAAWLGALFLRRRQLLTDTAVRNLVRDAVELAYGVGGSFQSWAHAPF